MAILTSPDTYQTHPDNAWKRSKFNARNKKTLGIFMAVAAWREREAQERNVPRNRVLKEDALGELAMQVPENPEALSRLRAVPRGFANSRQAKGLLEAIAEGKARDPESIPFEKRPGRPPVPAPASVMDLLKVTLKYVCEENGVAPKLIANSADIEAIALNDQADVKAMKGWRRKLYGDVALDVKHGKLAICLEDGQIVIEARQATKARAAE